jgi:RNA recognition motif-containing protein
LTAKHLSVVFLASKQQKTTYQLITMSSHTIPPSLQRQNHPINLNPLSNISNSTPTLTIPSQQSLSPSTNVRTLGESTNVQDVNITANQANVIDTAIVIKNIPYTYPENEFPKLFQHLGLASPYAFNYHLKNVGGTFHGLAFANFRLPQHARAAVNTLNNYMLNDRKLRVELKLQRPDSEERQGLDIPSGQVAQRQSIAMEENYALEPQLRPILVFESVIPTVEANGTFFFRNCADLELDMNDPETLGFYTDLQVFKNSLGMASSGLRLLQFPFALTPQQCRKAQIVATRLGLNNWLLTNEANHRCLVVISRTSS